MTIHTRLVWHPLVNIQGAKRNGIQVVPGEWILSHGFSRDMVLVGMKALSCFSWDMLCLCHDCCHKSELVAVYPLSEGTVRAIIPGKSGVVA